MREHRPDLVLLDLCMPDLDGIAVLRAMRRNPTLREMPVVLLTDRAERQYVLAAVEFGVQGYLLKSEFSLKTLLERVSQALTPVAKREPAPAAVGLSLGPPRGEPTPQDPRCCRTLEASDGNRRKARRADEDGCAQAPRAPAGRDPIAQRPQASDFARGPRSLGE